ncbi:hypothetical protein [Microlunatus sp. Gsoil 973]|uniref:hypothetical protein n=1 Tax=Microlunatus sp. Gsoil 973 TaxID=2672569 RepID=UPI0012B4EE8E|nr:hypothetical protein [Microlunatus sp. Gsoil 973]QGN31578.1 hypothetical protein GJV80_00625 [Microlunatus sp. Gsoil 973]
MTPDGVLLPSSLLGSPFFAVLSTLVALNTLIFVTLAITKMLPAIHFGEVFARRGRRKETRSIYPDAPLDA